MTLVELTIVLLAIYLGARLGSIGIGYAGGMGVLALAVVGVPPGNIPVAVILIIMSVIAAIAAMQLAGGMQYLVMLAERLLRSNPRQITFLAPMVTYLMTLMAGTGHTAFSTLPVITEVAKEQGIRPSRPLSVAVVASQIAITASPVSAAVVAMSGLMEPLGVSYLTLLMVTIPTTFVACMVAALVANRQGVPLAEDPIYQQRLAQGLVGQRQQQSQALPEGAKRSVAIFLLAILAVVAYATATSPAVGLITEPTLGRDHAIMVVMLTAATAIVAFCAIDASQIVNQSTFKSGMSACICVLGVGWLGDSFVSAHIEEIKALAGDLVQAWPFLLSVALFFSSMLLYSQAAATIALMPAAVSLGVDPVTLVASFAAVSALFVLPTYPTLLAAVEMDDTGTTRIGRFVFDHPFLLVGVTAIAVAVTLGFVWGEVLID
ncbi:anaerobic C4-dicarboxylate transporter [Ferrimonas marina]|uniref:C4-dicarboxylate transporter n=1 Tax=Ferrimonas marina TaxID=299255 RepID=A0A1M5YG60_9GAMM|nr:anaerobic C4-dicarboxylate transporter [Ferrimonas marina]SHI11051.1 anaerobic C4-dicarboxylate transporter DcuA [Ferrimonas marina]